MPRDIDALRDAPEDQSNLVVSFPKSGRTWLSYLYAYYAFYYVFGDQADALIDAEFTPTAHIYRPLEHPLLIQRLFHDHEDVPPLRVGHYFDAAPYFEMDVALSKVRGKRAALLVRDPRDVVVSYFHHTMQRAAEMRQRGKATPSPDVDLSEFIRGETHGIRAIVAYMNQVLERGPQAFGEFRVIHYEDLVALPQQAFREILSFFGASIDEAAIASAVDRASFGNLKQLEVQRRSRKGMAAPPSEALRFRRGVPGSHRSELSPDDVTYLDRVIRGHLAPAFRRYCRPPS